MTNSEVVSMRVPPELLKRIDRHGQEMAEAAGVPMSRAVVAKKLIEIGLAQVEAAEAKKARKK